MSTQTTYRMTCDAAGCYSNPDAGETYLPWGRTRKEARETAQNEGWDLGPRPSPREGVIDNRDFCPAHRRARGKETRS